MKDNELMIGDWVRIANPYAPCRGQVVAILDDMIQFVFDMQDDEFNTHIMEAEIEELQPIPITAEILEKNGFVKGDEISDTPPFDRDEEGNMYYSYKGEHKFWGWWQPNNIYFIPANAMGNLNIEFVHELQHVLRFCRIDKEITL